MTNNSLYCIEFNVFERFRDVNLFETVTTVAGRLIRTSLVLFQDSTITFIAQYVACVSHNSLYSMQWIVYNSIFLGDLYTYLFITLARYLFQDSAITFIAYR